jgi:amidase
LAIASCWCLLYELKADLNAYLARLGPGAPVRTLKDIIDFNERNRQKEMPYFGQDIFIKSEAKGPLTEKEYSGRACEEPPAGPRRRH